MASITLDPRSTAVVCIECQNGVVGSTSMLPALAADAADTMKAIGRLLTSARAAQVLVAHATFEGYLGGEQVGTAPLYRRVAKATRHWEPGHPDTQVLPELLDPSDLVLPRHHGLNPAWGTELLPVLRQHGVQSLILTGVSLNVAIPLAVGQAAHEGFTVIVPRDAVAGTPLEYGEMILQNTVAMLATVTSVDDLIASWA
jgi:nicotinamidase-related amidase